MADDENRLQKVFKRPGLYGRDSPSSSGGALPSRVLLSIDVSHLS